MSQNAGSIYLESSPAIGADGTIYAGSSDGGLYAVSPNGTLKWRFQAGNSIGSSPAVGADRTIFFGCYDAYVYAVRADGTLKWKFLTYGQVTASPALSTDGIVYITDDNGILYALNPDGTKRWFVGVPEESTTCSSVTLTSDGKICVYDGHYLAEFNSSGKFLWYYETSTEPGFRNMISSTPAIGADGSIYFGSSDNTFRAVTPAGKLKWSFQAQGEINASPAIAADGTIVISSSDSYLYAFTPQGKLRWKSSLGDGTISSPAIGSDGTIYVSCSSTGDLYAFGQDGSLTWHRYDINTLTGNSSIKIGADGVLYYVSNKELFAIK